MIQKYIYIYIYKTKEKKRYKADWEETSYNCLQSLIYFPVSIDENQEKVFVKYIYVVNDNEFSNRNTC